MNDTDMENHSMKSKQKKNGGQTKRRLPALKSHQVPLLQRDMYMAAGSVRLCEAGLDNDLL